MFHLAQLTRLASRVLSRATNNVTNSHLVRTNRLLANAITTRHGSTSAPNDDATNTINVTFVRQDGTKISVKTNPGKTLYDAVIDNNVDIDGFGACEGTLCCTTCHLIFKEKDYEKVGGPSDEEMDMLDLAYGLTDYSRLGCQVHLKKEWEPLEVLVPESINDVREC
jgi:ferredoxin